MPRIVLSLLVAALCVSACGAPTETSVEAGVGAVGAEPDEVTLAGGLLAASIEELRSGSAHFEGRVQILDAGASTEPEAETAEAGSALPMGSIEVRGRYDLDVPAVAVDIDLSVLLQAMAEADPLGAGMVAAVGSDPIEMIVIGDTAWSRWAPLLFLGFDGDWVETPAATAEGIAGELGIGGVAGTSLSPAGLLRALAEVPVVVEAAGNESIRGTDTTRHRVRFADPATTPDSVELTIWTDDDGRVHRFVLTAPAADLAALTAAAPEPGSAEDAADQTTTGVIVQTWDLWDHGAEVSVDRPTGRLVRADELDQVVDNLFGMLG
jgi:hypothetical protein